jgi:hypothetical protein
MLERAIVAYCAGLLNAGERLTDEQERRFMEAAALLDRLHRDA